MEIRRIKPLFDELSALPKAEQAVRLSQLSIGDTTRKALARLLQLDESLAATPDGALFAVAPDPALPEQIGPYRVERLIGSGGMGRVYAATRDLDGVQQRLAIKVIRPDRPDESAFARFQTERQVLALLKHPNIASLIDWGDDEAGQPYLVMELADGLPIDRHVNEHAMPLPERIRLVRTVATAIAHAHRNLIIHRDLKPGNVMVDENGIVKVIDFGIAKPLMPMLGDHAVDHTGTDQRFFSPRSAAPELLRGGTAAPASDVYGLGVLLYELTTDRPVFDLKGRSASEVERMILEVDPIAPSRVAPSRAGGRADPDLDAIILCCLRKDPKDRYASVDSLIDDLDAWAAQRPVAARRGGRTYRLRRFAQRNRWLLFGGLATALTAAVALWLTLAATQSIEIEQARSGEYARMLMNPLERPLGIASPQRDQIMELIGLSIQRTQQEPDSEDSGPNPAQLDHVEALFRIGNPDAALQILEVPHAGSHAFDPITRRQAALATRIHLANAEEGLAMESLNRATTTSTDPDYFDNLFLTWRTRIQFQVQDPPPKPDADGMIELSPATRQSYQPLDLESFRDYIATAGKNKLKEQHRRDHLLLMADLDVILGQDQRAMETYRALLDRLDAKKPADVLMCREVRRRMLAGALRLGDTAAARAHFSAAEAISARLSGKQAEPGLATRAVVSGLETIEANVNTLYLEQARDLVNTYGSSSEVLAESERLLRLGLDYDVNHANTHVLLGYVLTHSGRLKEARAALDRAEELAADNPWLHVNRGDLFRRQGDLVGARASLTRALERSDLPEKARAAALTMLGAVEAELGHGDDSRRTFEAAVALRPDAATIGNFARILRVNLLDVPASEARAREALALSGGSRWHEENLGATLWLKWAETRRSGSTSRAEVIRAEAQRLFPDPGQLVFEFHHYPRVHDIMHAMADLGIHLGADPDFGQGGTTPMELAVGRGNVPIVKGLIALGVSPDARGFEEFPPLGIAIMLGKPEVAIALLEAGADPHQRSTNGESILDLAARTPSLLPEVRTQLTMAAQTRQDPGHRLEGPFPAIGYLYSFRKKPDRSGLGDNGNLPMNQPLRYQGARPAPDFHQDADQLRMLEFISPDGKRRYRWILGVDEVAGWAAFLSAEPESKV